MLSVCRQPRALGSVAGLATRSLTTSAPRHRLYDDITQTIGRTPIVRINKLAPEGCKLYAKLEYFNPLGSVKDRLAIAIIEHAERTGRLQPGGTVVEATSGNTGIALAMVCAQRGYKFVATMAASFSVERRKVMRMLGAQVVVTPAPLGGTGMVLKAEELAEQHGWYLAQQFETEANAAYHAQTTGPEILSDFAGHPLDYYVTGYGTGGTFSGAGAVIKAARPGTKIILSEPSAAPMVSSGEVQERKTVAGVYGAPAKGHSKWSPHPIQGWAPNFIPQNLQQGLDAGTQDEVLTVNPPAAIETAQLLARQEGIFCGISGGANMRTALDICERHPGSTVLAMIPDTAERYLSTPLFASIDADMDAEEQALSQSTPSAQLGA